MMDDLNCRSRNPRWFRGVLFAGMLLFAFYASTHMVAAGDTWVAMACGRHFANHGVDNVEPFSFNSHPPGPSEETLEKFPEWTHGIIKKWHPTGWINQNWLTHLIFYKIASWFGSGDSYNYNTLVYWKFIIYFLTVGCAYAIGRTLGVEPILSAAAACLAMVVGRTFYDIRPAGYSNLLVPALILVLALTTYRNYRLIWLIVPLVVFWANVHGGYLYAFIMMVPFIGVHLLLRLPKQWAICLGFVGLWLVLYLMSYKFITNSYYLQVLRLFDKDATKLFILKDKFLYIWLVLACVSVGLTCLKQIKPAAFYAYHIGGNIIYFVSLGTRFLSAKTPQNLSSPFDAIYSSFISSSQMSFFFVFVVGGLLVLAMGLKKDRFVALPIRGIYHTIGASVAAFLAMIIFNPFHLTNLTHTFEISLSEHAESWRQVNEWKPAFDWMDKTTDTPNPVGEEEAFAVLCIVTLAAMLVWLIAYFLKPRLEQNTRRKAQIPDPEAIQFQWPKIDLAIIVISLLTLYMAIRSRRFIAIAGSAAAPIAALFIFQCVQMVTARYSWVKKSVLRPMTLPPVAQLVLKAGIVAGLVGLGVFWGVKYKHIYLDPWPTNDRYTSVFMRMTASHLKPFGVCEFINENDIRGRVYNYWTEGGAIAFGETADPDTGQIPLKLFMDGRAQAAYNHDKFKLWQSIHSGGPDGIKATKIRAQVEYLEDNRLTNTSQYTTAKKLYNEQFPKLTQQAGEWIDKQLRKYEVWVVLMPQTQSQSIFMLSLNKTNNWKTAYIDSTQHLLVDTDTPQGKDLINRILNDEAVFPNTVSKKLSTATVIMESRSGNRFTELYQLLSEAFQEQPASVTAIKMTRLSGISTFRQEVADFFQSYLNDLNTNRDAYRKTNGYAQRLSSANVAARYLATIYPNERNDYIDQANSFTNEYKQINNEAIW